MSKKIVENANPKKPTLIKENQPVQIGEDVYFSFKYLDLGNKKFNVNAKNNQYFEKLLERLKSLSALKILELISNRSQALRAHPIDWQKTTEKDGFKHLNEQLKQIQPYQFEISANKHGRIHGFIIENVFFVIWFDPDHKLYT